MASSTTTASTAVPAKKNDSRKEEYDFISSLVSSLGYTLASIFRKVPENVHIDTGSNKYSSDWTKYIIWFLLFVIFCLILGFVFKGSNSNRNRNRNGN